MSNSKGISLISVIITIIVIIILAAISIFSGYKTPDTAMFSKFTEEINSIRVSVARIRANDLMNNDDENYSFTEVELINTPSAFVSFSNDSKVGYLIDVEKLDYDVQARGKGTISGGKVTFDEDDVFVYDKNGAVYYAKGFENNGVMYYNVITHK